MVFGSEMDTREWLLLLWTGKFRILACGVVAAIIGVGIAAGIPKVYETVLIARPASEATFAPLAESLTVPAIGGQLIPTAVNSSTPTMASLVGATKLAFLAAARDRDYLRTYALSHQDFMAGTKLDSPDMLQKTVFDRFDVIPSKDAADDSFQLRFRYGAGASGAQFLNGFAKTLIDKTTDVLRTNARSMLETAKISKENELTRLREIRDIRANQQLLEYREALETAKSVNIEKPFVVSQDATSNIVVAPGWAPLFLRGSHALTTEMKNIEARKGNDLAIPEFSEIASSITDIGKRLSGLDQIVVAPIVITQLAYEGRPTFPPRTPIVLICIAIGAAMGAGWQYLKSQQSAAKPQG